MGAGAVSTEVSGTEAVQSPPANNPDSTPVLFGWSLRETGGVAPLIADLHAGTDATGPVVAHIDAATDGSSTRWFGDLGVRCRGGIFLNVTSGSASGAVYWK